MKTPSLVMSCVLCAAAAGTAAAAPDDKATGPVPPGYTTALTGSVHDFDYLVGAWTIKQRRLKARGVGSKEWDEFPGVECMVLYLEGMATVDELYMPKTGRAGLTLRTFDLEKHQWSIYWVSSADGKLGDPVVGGFQGNIGHFYGLDADDGRPIKVRFEWTKLDHDHARWEQAFSYDNRTWETNWIAEFTRADTATTCAGNRPKR